MLSLAQIVDTFPFLPFFLASAGDLLPFSLHVRIKLELPTPSRARKRKEKRKGREEQPKRRERFPISSFHRTSANTLSARSGAILPSVISASRLSTSASPRAVWRYRSAGDVEGAAMFWGEENRKKKEREKRSRRRRLEKRKRNGESILNARTLARPLFFLFFITQYFF